MPECLRLGRFGVSEFTLIYLLNVQFIIQLAYLLLVNLNQSNDLEMDFEIFVQHLIDIYLN